MFTLFSYEILTGLKDSLAKAPTLKRLSLPKWPNFHEYSKLTVSQIQIWHQTLNIKSKLEIMMKMLRVSIPLMFLALWFCSMASAQTPTITSYSVNGCTYTVGVSSTPCPMGPGSLLTVNGSDFGTSGVVGTCDCGYFIPQFYSSTRITVVVYSVFPNANSTSGSIQVETSGGIFSNAVPYTPLAAQITKLVVGNCTYIPGQSSQQCVITAGTQFTIYGNYFGAGPLTSGPQVSMCDCNNPTINSWDPGWTTNPTATGNVIVATAQVAECGNSIVVWAESFSTLGSNPVPYTTCK
jgi:hypothetical protein